jgi:Ca2+-binding RTX toxin-like protein
MLLIRSDLDFILTQVLAAETQEAPETPFLPFGLRTVSGIRNSAVEERFDVGAADRVFPRLTDPVFDDAEMSTSYRQVTGTVIDAQPRIISNLIADQNTLTNPAVISVDQNGDGFIPNVAPDVGAAPFNQWFTLFGQFFDHGLDLVNKGKSGTVFIPLQPGDPLFVPGSKENFMVVTRATNQPGPDGVVGTADDVHEHTNQTTPFIDQNQTYTSHPSHQVFLREYRLDANGRPTATGGLLDHAGGGLPTWEDVKAQARSMLGIDLTDADVTNIPLLATDDYGRFLPGPNGFAQLVMPGADGKAGTADDVLVEGNPAAPIGTDGAVRTGHAFLDDIAHDAVPTGKVADGDLEVSLANLDGSDTSGNYDNELLDRHYVTGDGRGNENIGLTAVHHIFHTEHNRLLGHIKDVIGAELATDPDFVGQWLKQGSSLADGIQEHEWNGERLFQAARFGTEMQYQHLVFENFARRIQPDIDVFEAHDLDIDPAITAEFAHTVYRFGHSLLRETVDRIDSDGNVVDADPLTAGDQQMTLVAAFLNPQAYAQRGTPGAAAAEIVRGAVQQPGNELDEFVTDALRNSVYGLPLDLAAINLARGRDTGIPPLNDVRRQFHEGAGDPDLKPYSSWAEFGHNIRHPGSLINFIAAYGIHPLLADATTDVGKRAAATVIVEGRADDPATPENEGVGPDSEFLNGTGAYAGQETGIDDVDFWIGGLAEKPLSTGGLLGATFNFVFETQMESLQDGDRFYYLSRLDGTNFLTQLEGTSFSELVMRNTDMTHLPFDIFSVPSYTIEVGDPSTYPASVSGGFGVTTTPDGEVRYKGDAHVVMGGTDGSDRIRSGEGDDTLWGDGGNDSLAGGPGDDALIGGGGNDRMAGEDGDDFFKGEAGDDRMTGGHGADLLVGLEGQDKINGGPDDDEVFGGLGNDRIFGGEGDDELLGNEGDDWIKGGPGDDHLIGDNGNPFGAPLADTDTASFSGKRKNYTIETNADGTVTVTDKVGTDGSDTLENIEILQFADRWVLTDDGAAFGTHPRTSRRAEFDRFSWQDLVVEPESTTGTARQDQAHADMPAAPDGFDVAGFSPVRPPSFTTDMILG